MLRQGVQGISDLITVPGLINLDFADVKTIMRDAGSSMMGIGIGTGDNRAVEAARAAVMSPLLEVNITGARGILFNVTGGSDLGLFEVNEAAEVIKEAADPEANIIFGTVIDDRMRDEVKVTVIATGFDATRKPRPASRAVTASSEVATGIEASLDERSREILAEIERDRAERQALEDQMPEASPFAASERPAESSAPDQRAPANPRPWQRPRSAQLRRDRPRHPLVPAPQERIALPWTDAPRPSGRGVRISSGPPRCCRSTSRRSPLT